MSGQEMIKGWVCAIVFNYVAVFFGDSNRTRNYKKKSKQNHTYKTLYKLKCTMSLGVKAYTDFIIFQLNTAFC